MNKKIVFPMAMIMLCILTSNSCKKLSPEAQIHKTMYKIIKCSNNDDYYGVIQLLGSEFDKEDTFHIKSDVSIIYYILTKYHNNNIDSLKWSSDYKVDDLGRIKFTIPLFHGFDSLTGLENAELNLYFGPKELIPFTKTSGFEYNEAVNSYYRGQLLDKGKLLDDDEVLKTLKKRR